MDQLKILITDQMVNTISQEMIEKYGYTTYVWWAHDCFQNELGEEVCKFIGDGVDSYVVFPNEDMIIMFMLKYGAK